MNEPSQPRRIALEPAGRVAWSPDRRGEPVTVGIPFPAGALHAASEVALEDSIGRSRTVQARALDHWPDGSVRWLLTDFRIDTTGGEAERLELRIAAADRPDEPTPLEVHSSPDGVRVSTGCAAFGFVRGGSFPVSEVTAPGGPRLDLGASGFRLEHGGRVHHFSVSDVVIEEAGPLRVAIEVRGSAAASESLPIDVIARIEAFASSATLRIAVTMTNPRRASHPGGFWTLGDAGSILLTSASLVLTLAEPAARVSYATEYGDAITEGPPPFEILQESSGGEHWNGPIHRNRHGRVDLRFRGFRRRVANVETAGERATPIVVAESADGNIAVALPKFWQTFPRALNVRERLLEIEFLPRDSADLHELQGGERKTDVAVIAFAPDGVSRPPLAWVHDPVLVYPPVTWCCDSSVVPFLTPEGSGCDTDYSALVAEALEPLEGLTGKRELADEFGWRNFGDLPADHESAFQPAGQRLVSHYNNQYDAVAAFGSHFLRTGNRRWWEMMVELATHTRDIDIYHTAADKAAYNGGLFWHTLHYADAGTSTHRTYPIGGYSGGGPSGEHNYSVGLMLHYFMTGEPASRRAAIGLGEWVLAMDDGSRTPFRWLAQGATGLASQSGSEAYHGPGRGAANSILACMVAHRLTRDPRFAAMADTLIRRCIHPSDDLELRHLLDVEQRWFYTVFLQVLGLYLHEKSTTGQADPMFVYGRESLLHYARWMTAHERPYLDRPERLEFPTETWPAQDLRKGDVFFWAAMYSGEDERPGFLERARFFRDYALRTLAGLKTRRFTRPTVLLLSQGYRLAGLDLVDRRDVPAEPGSGLDVAWPPVRFEPQKARAIRHFKWVVAIGLALVVVGTVLLLGRN